ncbi:hypothetical protein, partial [Marinimicrobium locisalis]|uniref:hypothetical protein n=1 Tax=Marinimicrobium locisalis TaxID=546022 RepID=UPI0032218383
MFDENVSSGFGKQYRITQHRSMNAARDGETLEDFRHCRTSAEGFVKGLRLSEYDLSQLVSRLVGSSSHWMSIADYEQQLAKAIASGSLLVYSKTPAKKRRPTTAAGLGGAAKRKPEEAAPAEPVSNTA